jgi:UDP-glucose 4-epimerase
MKILVTGSSGHLGEALVRRLTQLKHTVVGLDAVPSPFTTQVASIGSRDRVRACMQGADAVLHAATLHKPHVATHSRQSFVDTNISGTLNLLEEAVVARVGAFVFTSTTSAFGAALTPPAGAPAAWITEEVQPVPRNIYGTSKIAAEDLCQLFSRNQGLPCVVLRTSRFFPEHDDDPEMRGSLPDANLKANEFLHRRVDLEDVVSAHLLAIERAPALRFDKFIISATTPFTPTDLAQLRSDAAAVLQRRVPRHQAVYAARGWSAPAGIDRVYVNDRARSRLGWSPVYDFDRILDHLQRGEDPRSDLARLVGAKGYHGARRFSEGPYPVQPTPQA